MNHSHSTDAHITHSLTVILSSINEVQTYICIIDKQSILPVYCYLRPAGLSPRTISVTTTRVKWAMDDVAISRSPTFGRQFAACRSSHYFLITIASLSYNSWYSSFSLISITYQKQLSKSWPCGPGLSGELCNSLHGWMHHNGCHAYRFVWRCDRSFYNLYDITYIQDVGTFHH